MAKDIKRKTSFGTAAVVPELTKMRERFRDLDGAIDRIVWQLVGLALDGSLPT